MFVVLSHSPTLIRLRAVWAEEGEASGFTAGSLPVENVHVDGNDMPPVDTGAHAA